jgi:hypothetical protein
LDDEFEGAGALPQDSSASDIEAEKRRGEVF